MSGDWMGMVTVNAFRFSIAGVDGVWDQGAKFGAFKRDDGVAIFDVSTLSQMVENFSKQRNPIPGDVEHQAINAPMNGRDAGLAAKYDALVLVANGQVVKFHALRTMQQPDVSGWEDGLYAHRNELTPYGRHLLVDKGYGLISPTFSTKAKDEQGNPIGYQLLTLSWIVVPFLDGMEPVTFHKFGGSAERITNMSKNTRPAPVTTTELPARLRLLELEADVARLKAAQTTPRAVHVRQDSLVDAVRKVMPMALGVSGQDFAAYAKQIVTDRKVTLAEAQVLAARERPDLWASYRAFSSLGQQRTSADGSGDSGRPTMGQISDRMLESAQTPNPAGESRFEELTRANANPELFAALARLHAKLNDCEVGESQVEVAWVYPGLAGAQTRRFAPPSDVVDRVDVAVHAFDRDDGLRRIQGLRR